MSAEPFQYKLFDLYTQSYILTDSQDPNSVLIEEVHNSLLEKILPLQAKQQLSIATISEGMDAQMIDNNHPDSENNVLLLAKGSRGIYGPPEYKKLLAPYLDLVTDYPYQRYLTNENISLETKDVKIWVVDDEQGISGVEGVDSKVALNILGDSHGKMSLPLAEEMESAETLMQYRMIGANPQQGWFAKGTFAPSLKNTLAKFELNKHPELKDLDLIVPTSSLKGFSKTNLPPGVHQQQVHLTNHDVSHSVDFSMRAVVEKLDGDALAGLLTEQSEEIDRLNQIFANDEALNEEFLKSLQPVFMRDPNNPEAKVRFDPERWEECGDWKYITFRKDWEGHRQLVNSPIFAQDKQKWYASRARKASQLSFVKAKGGTIFCSSELTNNQIYVPQLPDGAKLAAVRSPIINLADIALVENKVVDDIYNDNGKPIQGAIVCSPQQYDALFNQTKLFMQKQTAALVDAGIDVSDLNALNLWAKDEDSQVVLANLDNSSRIELVDRLNQWRETYNNLAIANDLPELAQIRQDTFASIIKCDYDGDKIAFVSQAEYPAVYAGIAARIAQEDTYTTKLEKIKVEGERSLSALVADKVDPYSLGKTANLAENLQSFAVAAGRVENLGTVEQQEAYLKKIAPSFYYLIANPSAGEIKEAEANKLVSSFRYYEIGSTGEKLIAPALIERFDAYGLDKALLQLQAGKSVSPIVRQRLFSVWQELLLDINKAVAQQNQIAVDTFKSERPIDRDLIENVGRRLKILDDGLKKSLNDNQTFLTNTPEIKNSLTNRSLFVENVVQNLVPYQASVNSYQQIQGLFPEVEDEQIQQEVATLSNEYDKLTSLAGIIRQKARIDNGPSLFFNDGSGRSFEITNLLDRGQSIESLQAELVEGKVDIRLKPNSNANSPHKLFAQYRRGGEWQNLGTVCNACTESLDLDTDKTQDLVEVTGIKFASNSAVHLADSYAQSAYKKAAEFRDRLPEGQVDRYAAATYNYLTKTTSKGNRLGLMFQMFGKELAERTESMQLDSLKLDFLSGASVPDEPIEIEITTDSDTGKQNVMWVKDEEKQRLGSISAQSFQLRSGTTAKASASYIPPSVADITLPSGEKLTVGGMNKSMFATAGEILAGENLEMEVMPGEPVSHPTIMVDGKVVGRLKESSAKYLEDNQLLNQGQKLDLTLTTIGKGRYQKLKAVTTNGKVLEISGLKQDFRNSISEQQVKATVGFESQKGYDRLYLYRQGKRIAAGEFNFGSGGSHRRSLDRLKELGLYKQPFSAQIDSRVSVMNLKVDPDSIVYDDLVSDERVEIERDLDTVEKNPDTDYFLKRQQQYQSYGLLRQRDYLNDAGEIESVLSLDLVVDKRAELPELSVLADFQELNDGDPTIADETTKGFRVISAPLASLDPASLDLIKQELKLKQIIDLSVDPAKEIAYQNQLRSNYPDRVDFEAIPNGSERLFLPRLEDVATDKFIPTLSLPLLAAIQSQSITPDFPQAIDLDRLDLLWLQFKLGLAENLSEKEIIVQSFTADNLAKIQQLTSGHITADGELVYQHLLAATDARFAKELETTLGTDVYQYHLKNAKRLIADETVPIVIDKNGSARIPEKLLVERSGQMPLPETIDKNLADAIEIAGEDEFGRVLNNPADDRHPDTEHPVNYEGVDYPSVQHAFAEIVNAESIPQNKTYGLVKSLMTAKLQQHPSIAEEIETRGGYKWLYSCSHKLEGNSFWSGKGKDSALVGVLSSALKQAKSVSAQPANTKKVITLKSSKQQQIQLKSPQAQGNSESTTKSNPTSPRGIPSNIEIKGKPISMNFDLKLGNKPNPLPVNNCFDAMRGHGRTHTTRNFQPFKAYGIKTGDLAIAYKGPRDNPTGQVVIRVGKQYRLKPEMLQNAEFQTKWAAREKHAPETLPQLFTKSMNEGKEVWGMTFEPLGDLVDGKILNFATGEELEEFKSTEAKTTLETNASKSVQPKINPGDRDSIVTKSVTAKPAPVAPIRQNNSVAMIAIPNVAQMSDFKTAKNRLKSQEQSNLKERTTEVLAEAKDRVKLLDTIKVWQTKNNAVCNSNSVIANFNDAPSSDELNYRAALVGRETGQKAVVSFRENLDGTDALISLNVPQQHDEYAIRAKLEEVGIDNYSLIPTPKFTKVVISDRGGVNLPVAEELAKNYATILRITQGQSTAIPEREFDHIIESFEKANRRDGREGNGDRSDSGVGQSQRGLRPRSRAAAIAPRLKTAKPAVSPITQQSELTAQAIPILRDLLNSTPGKRNFTDGEIVVKYDANSKTLSYIDLESSALKLKATHDGRSWQSDSSLVGALNKQDISLLKAALIIAKTEDKSAGSEEKSAFSSFVQEPANKETSEHQVANVER